jgi:hypothetical protein
MDDKIPAKPASGLQAKGMMPSILAAIVLLIGGIADALGLYFYSWYKGSLVLVFALGFLAYCLGLAIERRRGV